MSAEWTRKGGPDATANTGRTVLTYYERKARLPWGGQRTVAQGHGCSEAYVSMVMKGIKRDRAIERALAGLMRPATGVAVAFGPPKPVKQFRVTRAA